ncbi:MAG: ribbon-helix-helix protein, CopG family [Gammaproteobacteria bacterium]|nr:ribbon-helix-helix protein, CopG family [Gammaproteobacteria bacterium]
MPSKRSETVKFRVSPSELADIDQGAKRADVTRSAFVRDAALDAAVPVLHADRVARNGGPDNPLGQDTRPGGGTNGGHNWGAPRTWIRRLLPARAGRKA